MQNIQKLFFILSTGNNGLKMSHYTQDLLANGRVKLRFEGRDKQTSWAQYRERLDENWRNRSWDTLKGEETMTTMKVKMEEQWEIKHDEYMFVCLVFTFRHSHTLSTFSISQLWFHLHHLKSFNLFLFSFPLVHLGLYEYFYNFTFSLSFNAFY